MIKFSLLGPLAVHRDDLEVRIGSPKQRTLLIRLLLEQGRYVSVDVLIDDLWRGMPPAGATATLRSYVSHLRRALGEDADVLRSSGGKGYAADVAPDALDVVLLERLASEGRDLLARGDAAAALERFDRALALWRGEPLSDVAYEDFARAAVGRLTEVRVTVEEDRFEGLLVLGRHAEVVAPLEAFVIEHPLRERPHGQLMLALYRTGRAPEALDVYQRLSDRVADELGLDPSPGLADVRDRILRQAADLNGPSVEAAHDTSSSIHAAQVAPVPQPQPDVAASGRGSPLPAMLHAVVGRMNELDRLDEFLSRTRLVTLVGPGGAGKTTLALAGAHAAADRFLDGSWFVPLAAEREPARVAAAVADVIGVTSDSAVEDRLAARLVGHRALLVLDNCEHLADACARFVERLLQNTDHLRVATTSREALGVPGELQMAVPPLAPDEAATLFVERARAVRPDLDLDQYADAITTICDRLDGMPLAIELAAARVRTISPTEVVARLSDRFGLLTTGARTADSRHRTLRSVIDWSHDLLAPGEQTLFRRLAVFQGGWTLEAAEEVCDLEGSGDVLDRLDRLVDRSLVVVRGDRFAMLETILAYATDRLAEADEAGALGRRHATYFAGLTATLEPELRGGAQARALQTLRAEDQNLRAALRWSREHAADESEVGLGLAASLGWYWYVGRQVDGRDELAAMLNAATAAPDRVRARALQALSLALRPGGCIVHAQPDAAEAAREAVRLFSEVGAAVDAARCRLLAAVEGVAHADPEAALAEVEAARAPLHEGGDDWAIALADFVEMEIRLHHGEADAALELGRRAARRFDDLDDAWGRSAVRLHLGIGLRLAGALDRSASVLEEAVEISRATVLDNNLARSLVELGETALGRGAVAEAERHFDDAEVVVRGLADDLLLGLLAVGRGDLARMRGDARQARARYRDAAERFRRIDEPSGLARALRGAGAVTEDLEGMGAAHD